MTGFWTTLAEGGVVSQAVFALLMLMSVASWVVLLYKARMLLKVKQQIQLAVSVFWQAPNLSQGLAQVQMVDAEKLVVGQIDAVLALESPDTPATLGDSGEPQARLTRMLRVQLQQATQRLQWGQIVLATVGSVAPFVGLLGTVWGIHQALIGMVDAGPLSMDDLAGPVGEALIMTAAGLGVAIPAVLAYNLQGRLIGELINELEGFAHDLRELSMSAVRGPLGLSDKGQ